jgi:hypothetical protein
LRPPVDRGSDSPGGLLTTCGRRSRVPIWQATNDNGQMQGNWPLDARWRARMPRSGGRKPCHLRSGRAVAWTLQEPAA